jgi:hypothetical protein
MLRQAAIRQAAIRQAAQAAIRQTAILAALLASCGGAPSATEGKTSTVAMQTNDSPSECDPKLAEMDFAALAALDTSKALLDTDTEKVEKLLLGLLLGSDIGYAHWGPTGTVLAAMSGCEEEECSAGVALVERNKDGFFVKKTDTSLPSVLGGGIDLEHVFIANQIGDEAPEFWVVYNTYGQGDESEKNIAVYTLSGLKLLWSMTLGSADDRCTSIVHTGDLECDGNGDTIVKRSCAGAPIEEARYLWRDGKLRAPVDDQAAGKDTRPEDLTRGNVPTAQSEASLECEIENGVTGAAVETMVVVKVYSEDGTPLREVRSKDGSCSIPVELGVYAVTIEFPEYDTDYRFHRVKTCQDTGTPIQLAIDLEKSRGSRGEVSDFVVPCEGF